MTTIMDDMDMAFLPQSEVAIDAVMDENLADAGVEGVAMEQEAVLDELPDAMRDDLIDPSDPMRPASNDDLMATDDEAIDLEFPNASQPLHLGLSSTDPFQMEAQIVRASDTVDTMVGPQTLIDGTAVGTSGAFVEDVPTADVDLVSAPGPEAGAPTGATLTSEPVEQPEASVSYQQEPALDGSEEAHAHEAHPDLEGSAYVQSGPSSEDQAQPPVFTEVGTSCASPGRPGPATASGSAVPEPVQVADLYSREVPQKVDQSDSHNQQPVDNDPKPLVDTAPATGSPALPREQAEPEFGPEGQKSQLLAQEPRLEETAETEQVQGVNDTARGVVDPSSAEAVPQEKEKDPQAPALAQPTQTEGNSHGHLSSEEVVELELAVPRIQLTFSDSTYAVLSTTDMKEELPQHVAVLGSDDQPVPATVLDAVYEDLSELTMSQLFERLRQWLPLVDEHSEVSLHFPDLNLHLGEDNIFAPDLRVHELMTVWENHVGGTMRMGVTEELRFITVLNSLLGADGAEDDDQGSDSGGEPGATEGEGEGEDVPANEEEEEEKEEEEAGGSGYKSKHESDLRNDGEERESDEEEEEEFGAHAQHQMKGDGSTEDKTDRAETKVDLASAEDVPKPEDSSNEHPSTVTPADEAEDNLSTVSPSGSPPSGPESHKRALQEDDGEADDSIASTKKARRE